MDDRSCTRRRETGVACAARASKVRRMGVREELPLGVSRSVARPERRDAGGEAESRRRSSKRSTRWKTREDW